MEYTSIKIHKKYLELLKDIKEKEGINIQKSMELAIQDYINKRKRV